MQEEEKQDPVFIDMDPEWKKYTRGYIKERGDFLHSSLRDIVNKIQQFLFLTNSGGAVATLSYMGVNSGARKLLGIQLSLGSFLLGIIC